MASPSRNQPRGQSSRGPQDAPRSSTASAAAETVSSLSIRDVSLESCADFCALARSKPTTKAEVAVLISTMKSAITLQGWRDTLFTKQGHMRIAPDALSVCWWMMMTHLAAYEKQFNPLILQHEEEVIGDAALDYTWSQVVSAFFARKDILDPLEMLSAMEMAQYRLLNQKLVAAQEKFQCQQQERLQSADAETKRSRSDRLQQPASASFVTQSVLGAISEGRERERRKQADKVKAAALAAAEILNSRHRVNPDTMIPDQLAVDITRLAVGSSIIRCLLYLFRVITPLTDTQSAVLARKKDEVGSFLLWYEQKVNLNSAEARDVRCTREMRVQGDRGRLPVGLAGRLRLRAPVDRAAADPRRRHHPGADPGA